MIARKTLSAKYEFADRVNWIGMLHRYNVLKSQTVIGLLEELNQEAEIRSGFKQDMIEATRFNTDKNYLLN